MAQALVGTTTADNQILLAIKTPMMPRATSAFLPRSLTLLQALDAVRKTPPKHDNARRVLRQLERKTSVSAYDFLVIAARARLIKCRPRRPSGKSRCRERSVPRAGWRL